MRQAKRWIWVLGIPCVFFILDRVIGRSLSEQVAKSKIRYSRMYTGKAPADYLFVGNSRGLIFYQPEIEKQTGAKTFNLSYNGLPADAAKVLVADYLDRYPAPQRVFFEVTMADRVNPALATALAMYMPYSSRLRAYLQEQHPQSYYASQLSHCYRYNSEIFQRSLAYLQHDDTDWLLDRKMKTALLNPQKMSLVKYKNQAEMTQALKEMVNYCRQKEILVTLLVHPIYPPYLDRNVSLQNWIQSLSDALEIPVLDYSRFVKDPVLFGDYVHLNKQGATQYLEMLVREGVIPSLGSD